ncbi:MAG: site-specific integrase, partial [Bacteroidetes bacterium]|nr:site-specific integrase [Bacteroidota bacterium]
MLKGWNSYITQFKLFLRLEKSLSEHTIEAYIHDIEKLSQFFEYKKVELNLNQIEIHHLQEFVRWISELGMSATSQAR